MSRHSTNTASFFSILMAALIFSLSMAGVAAAQGNTSLGTGALQNNTTGSFNTAIGLQALFSNSTGTLNTASGSGALNSNTTGDNNTAIGVNALFNNTTGDFNTAIGLQALFNNTTGILNTASGVNALASNTTGTQNAANGVNALLSNTTGKDNTASGVNALASNTTGCDNAAIGNTALVNNTTGCTNTAIGSDALFNNTTGDLNTAIGFQADVSAGNLTNATAIGAGAVVNANNKIRLGNAAVAVLESQVALTVVSDQTRKENFKPVDGEEVLGKIRGFELSSWNFIGHDPKEFRHYGPTAQDFYAAFGHDGVGQIGSETTINSGDLAGILMIAVQALEKRTAELKHTKAQLAVMAERLEALELRNSREKRLNAVTVK
jgi:Chaperone of endosialidase